MLATCAAQWSVLGAVKKGMVTSKEQQQQNQNMTGARKPYMHLYPTTVLSQHRQILQGESFPLRLSS